jgi:hypothetical protein
MNRASKHFTCEFVETFEVTKVTNLRGPRGAPHTTAAVLFFKLTS